MKGTLLEEPRKLNIWPLLVFIIETDSVLSISRNEAEERVGSRHQT